MKCFVCETNENWHSLKELHSQKELQVCKTCGNVCFRIDEGEEDKIKNYYRFQYRPAPNHGNLITTTHKQNYIQNFLKDYLTDKKGLIVGDVGCATGYLVAFFRKMGHKATGCEYTLTYRRFAESFYGIPITEELRTDLKYDLITIYHVLEHMIEPDVKLAHYRSLLKDDGHMLISTPQWYDTLEEASGPPIKSFEELWHKNHINAFSRKGLNNLFKRIGLEVVKEDMVTYGQTYLVKKCEPKQLELSDYENPTEVIEKTHLAKKCIDLYLKKESREAIKLWPRMPDAWIQLIFETYAKDDEKTKDLWEEAFKVLPENKKLKTMYSCVYLIQRDRFKDASEVIIPMLNYCPDEEKLFTLGQCYAGMGNHPEAMKYFYASADMCPLKWQMSMDFMCKEASLIPAWDEKALQKISDDVVKKAQAGIKLLDPLFDEIKPDSNGKEGVKSEEIKA